MAKNSPSETRTSRMAYCSKSLLPSSANWTNCFQSTSCPSIGGRAATIPHIIQFDFSGELAQCGYEGYVASEPPGCNGNRIILKLANSRQIGFLRDIPRKGKSANRRVFEWWAWVDLNHQPRPYQGPLRCYMHSIFFVRRGDPQ